MTRMKKCIGILLCLTMICGIIWFPAGANASSTDAETSGDESYGAWKDQMPVNGDFEVGVEGTDVYGWSMEAATSAGVDHPETEANKNYYQSSFQLKTKVDENGNKVAEFKKTGSGYMNMVSQEITVAPSQTYYLCVDYFVKEVLISEGNANDQMAWGIGFYVQGFDENGEKIKVSYAKYSSDPMTESQEWETLQNLKVTTTAETKTVKIYLWLGSGYLVQQTVWLDNIRLYNPAIGEVMNGDFESSLPNGAPRYWTKDVLSFSSPYFVGAGTETEKAKFEVCTEQTERGSVAVLKKKGSVDSKSGALRSAPISVRANTNYTLSVDWMCRYAGQLTGSNTVYFQIDQKDAQGNIVRRNNNTLALSTAWKTHTREVTTTENAVSVEILFVLCCDPSTLIEGVLDNMTLIHDGGYVVSDWTMENCDWSGTPTTDNYQKNYGLKHIDGGTGYENALQLYVKRAGGTLGGAIAYSKQIPVESSRKYTAKFDLKIEGYDLDHNTDEYIWTRRVVLRYLDENGELLSNNSMQQLMDGRVNRDWTNYEYIITTPADAAFVQIGLMIGSNQMNLCPNLKYTFSNIGFAQETDTAYWNDYAKRRETDLLFVLLDLNNEATVKDLVDIKRNIKDNTYNSGIDMNKNSRITDDDAILMRWKLVGITKSSQLQ